METTPEVTERSSRPLLQLMRDRAEIDWGQHPNYTKEYRDLRWPGKSWRITDMSEQVNRARVPIDRDDPFDPVNRTPELFGPGIRVPEKPDWVIDANYRSTCKRIGTWNRNRGPGGVNRLETWRYLSQDLLKCMSLNIPFKTNTIEYKPSTQWVHIKGTPVVKYDLESGKLVGFTYSGVYDKVITFVLRNLFQMNIVLEKRKLIWRNNKVGLGRPGTFDLGVDIILDLTTFYHFRPLRIPDRVMVCTKLAREFNAPNVPQRTVELETEAEQGMRDVLLDLARRRRTVTAAPPLTTLLRDRNTTI